MNTPQFPLHSGFRETTTAREAIDHIDLRGKTAIVTGGYSGIGLETTRTLVGAGAKVIVPARNREKAQSALQDIAGVELDFLDLMDPSSISRFAGCFGASGRPLDLLVANAGIMAPPLTRDQQGNESQFSTNHLGHFQLVIQLWPSLRQSGSARVVILSSAGHRFSPFDFDDPNFTHRPYDKWKAYGQSKTANSLFAVALDKRGCEKNVRAFAVHPGIIVTDLLRFLSVDELRAIDHFNEDNQIPVTQLATYKTVEQGAATTIWCATNPILEGMGGVYCEDVDIARAVPADYDQRGGVRPWAIDPNAAERLWQVSEALTKVKFQQSD